MYLQIELMAIVRFLSERNSRFWNPAIKYRDSSAGRMEKKHQLVIERAPLSTFRKNISRVGASVSHEILRVISRGMEGNS